MGRFIPTSSLENLKKYAYSGVDKSLLSKYILNPFWNWFVTLWPLNVAPNTITLTGLSLVFFNFLTLLYYDPTYLAVKGGATGPPNWVYFTWAGGLFFYQALDAIDGKQARRTGMAGPLGEMFDHGCDAINTTLEVILASQALNLGRSWWTVASQIGTLANFYLTTWEEWHTGQLYLGPFSGPVEGIILIVLCYIITGFNGPEFWDTPILTFLHLTPYVPSTADLFGYTVNLNMGLNESFMVFATFGVLFNITSSYRNVLVSYSKRDEQKVGAEEKARMAGSPLLRLLPFVVSATLQIAWLSASLPLASKSQPPLKDGSVPDESNYKGTYSIIDSDLLLPFICAWGLQFAHTVGKMIIAHVTSTDFPMWDVMWVWSIVGAGDGWVPGGPLIQTTPFRTTLFVYSTLALSLLAYGRFCTLVIKDITEYLGIACFRVRKRDANGNWRDSKQLEAEKKGQ